MDNEVKVMNLITDGTNCRYRILFETDCGIIPYISIKRKVVVIKNKNETTILTLRRKDVFKLNLIAVSSGKSIN